MQSEILITLDIPDIDLSKLFKDDSQTKETWYFLLSLYTEKLRNPGDESSFKEAKIILDIMTKFQVLYGKSNKDRDVKNIIDWGLKKKGLDN